MGHKRGVYTRVSFGNLSAEINNLRTPFLHSFRHSAQIRGDSSKWLHCGGNHLLEVRCDERGHIGVGQFRVGLRETVAGELTEDELSTFPRLAKPESQGSNLQQVDFRWARRPSATVRCFPRGC